MVEDSKVKNGVFPGQAIRFPVEEKGRWVPLERKSYLEKIFSGKPFDDGIAGQVAPHIH